VTGDWRVGRPTSRSAPVSGLVAKAWEHGAESTAVPEPSEQALARAHSFQDGVCLFLGQPSVGDDLDLRRDSRITSSPLTVLPLCASTVPPRAATLNTATSTAAIIQFFAIAIPPRGRPLGLYGAE